MMTRKFYHLFSLLCLLCVAIGVAACGEDAPIVTPVKIIMFGDSLTEGYRLPTEQAVPARVQALFLAEGHHGVRIMNMGVSGDTTQNGLLRMNLLLQQSPDIVVLELGANDLLRRQPAEGARNHLATMIEAMQAQGVHVVLAGISVPAILSMQNPHLRDYPPMFEELAERYDVPLYPNFLSGVLGKSSLMLDDMLHPNAEGTQKIAERLYPLLRKEARRIAAQKQP